MKGVPHTGCHGDRMTRSPCFSVVLRELIFYPRFYNPQLVVTISSVAGLFTISLSHLAGLFPSHLRLGLLILQVEYLYLKIIIDD